MEEGRRGCSGGEEEERREEVKLHHKAYQYNS